MKALKTTLAAAAMLACSLGARAELMNISATAMHSATERAVACTIVDTGTTLVNGLVLVVFFAEGAGSGDPDIRVWSLDRSYSTSNNNWKDGLDVTVNGATQHLDLAQIYPADPLYYPSLLRAPARTNDAAVFVAATRGERFCAESFDRSGTGAAPRVSVSATDINALIYKDLAVKRANFNAEGESPITNALKALQHAAP